MANMEMCHWTERTESRHTRHKLAIIKMHLICKNRNIHPYIIRIRAPGKFKLFFLDLIAGRHHTVLERAILKEVIIVVSIFNTFGVILSRLAIWSIILS